MAEPALQIDELARAAFAERGLILRKQMIPRDRVDRVRDEIYALFERHGAGSGGQWSAGRPGGELTARLRGSIKDRMKQSAACQALSVPALEDAAIELMDGEAARTFTDRPQVLFTPPDASCWSVPLSFWHLDVPRLGIGGCPGVQSFCCIDAVVPGGGGTVVVSGSHKLVNDCGRVASRDVKKRLSRLPWFKELFSRADGGNRTALLSPQTLSVDNGKPVTLQVVELCGEPGDVYLVDLRTLHSLAPNTAARPRLAATQRYFRASVAGKLYAGQG
ncbi:MAG: hypothetical protein AB7I04_17720 [Pseudomonadales bacterium]